MNNKIICTSPNILNYELITRFFINNIMELPKLETITLNFGFLHNLNNKKQIIPALVALNLISSQNGVPAKSKKQIYNYKIRKGMIVGAFCTLRNKKMNLFFENFLKLDFLKNENNLFFKDNQSVKNMPSLTVTIKNLNIFPELESKHQLFKQLGSLNITFVFKNTPIIKKNFFVVKLILDSLTFPIVFRRK